MVIPIYRDLMTAPAERSRPQDQSEDELSVGRPRGPDSDAGPGLRLYFLSAHSRMGQPGAGGSQWQGLRRCEAGTILARPAPLVGRRRCATNSRGSASGDPSKRSRRRRQWKSCDPARAADLLSGGDRPTQRHFSERCCGESQINTRRTIPDGMEERLTGWDGRAASHRCSLRSRIINDHALLPLPGGIAERPNNPSDIHSVLCVGQAASNRYASLEPVAASLAAEEIC